MVGQYDPFALNMRNALPNATFIGCTGTLMAGEERTRVVLNMTIITFVILLTMTSQTIFHAGVIATSGT